MNILRMPLKIKNKEETKKNTEQNRKGLQTLLAQSAFGVYPVRTVPKTVDGAHS